ncbi:MAG: UbiD family decarboxylase [Deltaproteobacteria bacterium]|nr:MAG: UbiD family decarboxylase [Deltaproteobacteria bacterium]
MPFQDLREFISRCEQLGELQRVEREVDWNLEAGAITRRCCELSAPAPFFQKIKGYPRGYRILGASMATFKRLAIAMELNPEASFKEIVEAYMDRRTKPIKPRLAKDGPCKENVIAGDAVDLYKLPAPYIHGGDGGRYISTWHIIATKDPDSGWVNWGMYRQMIASKNTLTGLIAPAQHIGMIYRQKYEARNKPMEFAVAIGTEPITALVGQAQIPYGVSEMDVIGGIRGEPLDVIKGQTVDLLVPATSEVVIEGEVPPKERTLEGPFGEYAGYRAMPVLPRPIYKVKAITHRDDPILTMSVMGIAVDDSGVCNGMTCAAEVFSNLKTLGLPVTGVYVPPEGCITTIVIATKVPYANIASRIASAVFAGPMGQLLCKVIIVDDDVDPTNMREVIHAWATKCHPVRGTTVIPYAVYAPAVPYYSPEEINDNHGSIVYYDCTYPYRWPKEAKAVRSSFRDIYPEEIKQRVLTNWQKYGFEEGIC